MAGSGAPQQWNNKIEYILSVIGFAVGMGNMVSFPFRALKNGGGAFLFPYIIVLIIIAYPVMILESSIGQFTSQGPIKAYQKAMPILGGIGFAMMTISYSISVYYNVIVAWIIQYIFLSFSKAPAYNSCPEGTLDISCKQNKTFGSGPEDAANDNNKCWKLPQQAYFKNAVLGQPLEDCRTEEMIREQMNVNKLFPVQNNVTTAGDKNNAFDLGPFQWHIVGCALLSYLVVLFATRKGIDSSGKAMYVMMLFPAVSLVLLLLRGMFFPGALEGIVFFLRPEFDKINNIHIWIEATRQVFFSIGIGLGGLISLASFNPFKNNVLQDCATIIIADTGVSLLSGLTVFAYLGNMAHELNVKISRFQDSAGFGVIFEVFPFALNKCFGESYALPVVSIVFFMAMWFMGMSSMVGLRGLNVFHLFGDRDSRSPRRVCHIKHSLFSQSTLASNAQ